MQAWKVMLTSPDATGKYKVYFYHTIVADSVGKMLAEVEALAGKDKQVEMIQACEGEARIVP